MAKTQKAIELVPSGNVPGQFRDNSIEGGIAAANLQTGRGLQSIAGGIASIAAQRQRVMDDTAEDVRLVQAAGEQATVVGLVEIERAGMREYMELNGDHTTYGEEWDKREAKITEAIKGVQDKKTRDQLSNWQTKNAPVWKAGVTTAINHGIETKTRADALFAIDTIITSDQSDDALAAGDPDEGVFISEKEAKQAKIDDIIDTANVNGGLWDEDQVRKLKKEAGKRIDIYEKARLEAAEELATEQGTNDAFGIWEQTGDLNAAFEAIKNDPRIKDKSVAENDVETRVINREAANNKVLAEQQEKDLDGINKLLYTDKDYDKANIAIEESSLDEKAQGLLLSDSNRRAKAAAKRVPLDNDRAEEARLYEKSLDIWRGTTSKREFDEDLINNSKKLDDSAYQRVSNSAANTLKSSQAESLTRANIEATRQLVDFANEDVFAKFISDSIKGLAPDAAKLFEDTANEERQLQYWSLSRYNSEMRQWIEDNPDKTGKAFFQQSESLLHGYWDQSIKELKVLRAERVKEVEAKTGKKVPAAKTDDIPLISSQAEYDALPSGAKYIDTEGSRGTKK